MLTIRPATTTDIATVLQFIRALAEYEKLAHEVVVDEARIAATLFAPQPKSFCLIAEWNGEPVGFAIYFFNYSTFLGRHGLYVEDAFVNPEHRGKGIGQALFAQMAQIAMENQCGRMEWWVLDWNQPAIDFYVAMGAEPMSEWTVHRLSGEPLARLAASANHKKSAA